MKKNLLSVVILALLVVNLILTGIMMFSCVSANKKTAALVNDIASVLDLELTGGGSNTEEVAAVSVADTEIYNIADAMTVALRPSEDGKEHYCMCEVSFSMNKTHEDYETMSPMVATQESKIRSIIIGVIGGYTKEEAQANQKAIESEILEQVQQMFGSNFIYEAYFRDVKFQ
ncbi:MAG: flagellar basal body-associated FliL family protein [Lachnospiraceae bacterium]|jgi:flagellar basal body-associated protein FliL|nr:flagellar basal body-associated FliL family protein [Lachnospiraceae bacterium]MDD7222665.1 flagellar basal body-associated FliL family protein [Lachnospiraceae bacterium]MDO4508993.1 flagellar basal body-associated FliL family protein [Lachnospiraceae bacterium]MDY3254970.1 flagellar basal body-associated FliL family protein [Lachnospiraceae bacterium]